MGLCAMSKSFKAVGTASYLSRAILALMSFVVVGGLVAGHAEQPFMTLSQPRTGAWWLDAEFHPFTTEVRRIPAREINKSWCKATEFRKDLLPNKTLMEDSGGDSMDGYSFALEGNFDGSKRKQVALVHTFPGK